MKFKRCVTGGNFVIIHPGHIYLLKKAKELCKELYVVVAHDNRQIEKYGKILVSQEDRINMLKCIKYVDKVIKGQKNIQINDIMKEYKIDVIILGCDQEEKIFKNFKTVRIECYKKDKYSTRRLLKYEGNHHSKIR